MLQNQYYNSKLSKAHIEKILGNYNIKYNTMKKEIDAKFNNMIKLFLNDISAFLENIEEISNERKKIKEAENSQIEIALLKSKLEEKVINENKMKNEIDCLTKEISSLKTRMKIHSKVSKHKNSNSDLNNSNSVILKTERSEKIKKNRFIRYENGGKLQNKDKEKDKNKLNNNIVKTEDNRNNNYLSNSTEKRNVKELGNMKSGSIQYKNKNNYHSTEKRNLQNVKSKKIYKIINNKTKNNNPIKKTPNTKNKTINPTLNVSSDNLNNKKNKTIENENKKIDLLEIPPFEQSSEEEESGDNIEEEIKELELDEANIISLIEQIKNFNNNEEYN